MFHWVNGKAPLLGNFPARADDKVGQHGQSQVHRRGLGIAAMAGLVLNSFTIFADEAHGGGCCIQPVLKQQMMRNGQAQWKLRHRLLMAQRRRPTNWYTFAMLKIGSQIAGHFRLPVFWPHPSVAVICCWSFATMSVCIAHLMPRQSLPPPRIIPPKEGIMVDIIIQYTIYHQPEYYISIMFYLYI